MPLFFLISGFFAESAINLSPKQFIQKKSRELLLPYFSWKVILFIILLIEDIYCIRTFTTADYPNFFFNIHNGLWFLTALFVNFAIAYIGNKITKNTLGFIIITLALSYVTGFFVAWKRFPAFLVGIILKREWNTIKEHRMLIMFIGLVLWQSIYLTIGNYNDLHPIYISTLFLPELTHTIQDAIKVLEYIIMGIGGSLFFFLLFSYIDKFQIPKAKSIFANWGQYTLGIYITQSILLENIFLKLVNYQTDTFTYDFVITPLLSIAAFIVCLNVTIFISQYPKAAFLLLGKKLK